MNNSFFFSHIISICLTEKKNTTVLSKTPNLHIKSISASFHVQLCLDVEHPKILLAQIKYIIALNTNQSEKILTKRTYFVLLLKWIGAKIDGKKSSRTEEYDQFQRAWKWFWFAQIFALFGPITWPCVTEVNDWSVKTLGNPIF